VEQKLDRKRVLTHREVLEQLRAGHFRVDPKLLRKIAECLAHLALLAEQVEIAETIEPWSGSWSVAIIRISVDLPAPFGPSNPNMPRGIVSVTSFRA
jgi:hypothetical protein